ncbi:hypothetical protein [Rhizorhapis suberifaciens]|uniref:PRC-barrel protein n=1 Tax=Rhizorhapis suberifaciens TaxID=13656 RepID=A0A840HR09_9SPHN|nr:hypothetical protein [Rhizorhapis suberifaciens]MBB4640067.1 hypothetical protein [Rhizorhapis suberifaciens]
MDGFFGWYASLTGMLAAIVIASNLGRRITGWAFVLFATSSVAWIIAGMRDGEQALLWQNIVLLLTNFFGIYRWLILKERPKVPA